MGNFVVRYASRVIIYGRRAVIRLATGLFSENMFSKGFFFVKMCIIQFEKCRKRAFSRTIVWHFRF